MLSILIPTYNYNTYALVLELKQQADLLDIPYEILVQDDCSSKFLDENSKINELEHCFFRNNESNLGRTQNRTILANDSKYDLLLFLDADIMPENRLFLKTYVSNSSEKNSAIFGGITYSKIEPDSSRILRYKYGREREEASAFIRNLKPYAYIMSGNMLISKVNFKKCNFKNKVKLYGMDIFFSYQLFLNKISIIHIDNEIIHYGLESNVDFFDKMLKSIESRKLYLSNEKNIGEVNSLLKYYSIIKKIKLTNLIGFIFKVFKNTIKRKILNNNPNLFYLDLYRLGYICTLK